MFALSLSFGLTLTGSARADKAECVATSERAQQLRDDRKLLEARDAFLTCARNVCPPAIKKDCAEEVDALVRRTPSVVFRAKSSDGQDLVAVTVSSDGSPLVDRLDGRAVSLDPGVHTFRFEAVGQVAFEQRIVLAEGEHDRLVSVAFGGQGSSSPPVAQAQIKKALPVAAIITGGVGLVAMGVGSVFYAIAFAQKNSDETGCKLSGGCSPAEVDSIQTKLVVGDVVFYTGVAALAVGVVWTIFHYATNGATKEAPTALIDVGPSQYGRGAMATATIHW